jgi:hypothetical protein
MLCKNYLTPCFNSTVESDPDTRKALESKLRLLERKLELPSTFQSVQEVQMIANLKSFSDLIVHITVSCAQLIKASPVPGELYCIEL